MTLKISKDAAATIQLEDDETDISLESLFSEDNSLLGDQIQQYKSAFEEFQFESNSIPFNAIHCSHNFSGNYNNYVGLVLKSLVAFNKIKFENAIVSKVSKAQNYFNSDKKVLLLDLDETLIHAEEIFETPEAGKYTTVLSFTSEGERITIGVYVRQGVSDFLNILSQYFSIGIFTASCQEYADAIWDYLDPKGTLIKFRIYRESCISLQNKTTVKDLRILEGIQLDKVVIVDNSMYSFANQLSNGIWINSFYSDKEDIELFNVLSYLVNYVVEAEDVREVNERFFNFKEIYNQLLLEAGNA